MPPLRNRGQRIRHYAYLASNIITSVRQVLLDGHPERIKTELGVHREVFEKLVEALEDIGYHGSRYVSLKEQVAIFLYTCVMGLSVRHVGERFQCSNETIAKYFKAVLQMFSGPECYNRYVKLPSADDPIPLHISTNPKFYPFLKNVVGAIDGTHITCTPSLEDRPASRNRKGGVSQNCLACCSFDLLFQHVLSGWEGSVADATLFADARQHSLPIPEGKMYIGDAGFPMCNVLLVPYRGVRYHLAEWGQAETRPANAQELFNLRHTSARNVVERIFGILKRRFRILTIPCKFSMSVQARILPALCAIHNFIRIHDSEEINDFPTDFYDPSPGERNGNLGDGAASADERERAAEIQDQIAAEMWQEHQQILEMQNNL
ncbi:hypothetical protein NUW54_g43 [Trametes sanguinea]|uniref:Uncharacterized protein n=1 Tax=Trametes sanguinea TaxID=158606 RepID=A0ACC1QD16_9APHY|nr:hypothetical protein NUW54_g43 [Trametes sanguinea]